MGLRPKPLVVSIRQCRRLVVLVGGFWLVGLVMPSLLGLVYGLVYDLVGFGFWLVGRLE